jgi:Protein of unknown function (DUF541)
VEREIVVRGTGEAGALPDQASLRVEITADHKSQDEAYDARTKLAAGVDNVLRRHADAISRTTIASLVVQPRIRWHRGEDIRTGWRASRTSFVEVADLDALGEIMSRLVDAGAAVHGPQWSMAPTNPAYDQARSAAARGCPPPGSVLRGRARPGGGPRGVGVGARSAAPSRHPRPTASGGGPDGGRRTNLRRTRARERDPAEMTVQVDVEVGFTIIDMSGERDLDDLD